MSADQFLISKYMIIEQQYDAAHDLLDEKRIPRRMWNRRLSLAERCLILSGDEIKAPQQDDND